MAAENQPATLYVTEESVGKYSRWKKWSGVTTVVALEADDKSKRLRVVRESGREGSSEGGVVWPASF